MLPNEFTAVVLFFQQLGLSLAGASALWGLFFSSNAEKTPDDGRKKIFTDITEQLFSAFSIGFFLALSAWLFRIFGGFFIKGMGSDVFYSFSSFSEYLQQTIPLVWFVASCLFLLVFFSRSLVQKFFSSVLNIFYLISFVLVFVLISFPNDIEKFDSDKLFFIKQGFPLILTIGTVIVTDFLLFFTRTSLRAKRQIFPYLPTLHKLIWIGLGIHVLSDWVSNADLVLSPQFYFTQTVTAIVIINGMIFIGPLLEKLISGVSERRVKALEGKWENISALSSVISFSSWTSLTFIAFLPDAPLTYAMLMQFFIVKTLFVYGVFLVLERLTDIPVSFVNTN